MRQWATISIREELIDEIRNLVETSGRYRSISEFVAESIRRRLEEIASKVDVGTKLAQKDHPTQNLRITLISSATPQAVQDTNGYVNVQLQQSEQIWWVLVRLFGDFVRRNIKTDADYSRRLRNCRTLMDFVESHIDSECNMEWAYETLPDLQQVLQDLKRDLIAAAVSVSNKYAKEWLSEIDKAEHGELQEILTGGPSFVQDLLENNRFGSSRITLSKPIAEERLEEISRMFGVMVKPENSTHFVVRGEKISVKRAVELLHQIQCG